MRTVWLGGSNPTSFHMLDPDAPTEAQFEHAVVRTLTGIYKDYTCIVFTGTFQLDGRGYRPDLALVAKDFSHWFILEVELISHSLERHVLPQVRAFRNGTPQPDCISIFSRELSISREQAATLIGLVPYSVAVIATKMDMRWQAILSGAGIQMLAITRFQARNGDEIFEIEGSLISSAEHLGFGQFYATDRSLRFDKSVALPDGTVQVEEPSGATSLWHVTRSGGHCWVTKVIGTPSIPDQGYIQLLRSSEGGLLFRYPSR